MKSLRYLYPLLAALVLVACGGEPVHQPTGPQHTLTVIGEATLKRVPDRFMLRAATSRTGDDIAAMKQQLDQDIRSALQLAADLGIDEQQVQADSLSVQPEWQWQPVRELIGYRVSRSLTIASDGLETHAGMLEGLAQLGFSEIQPLGSTLSEPQAAADEALQLAMADARRRATLLAGAAQRELGEVLTIDARNPDRPGPVPMMMARAESDSGSWAPGETRIGAQVTVTYRLR